MSDQPVPNQPRQKYWQGRKHFLYYQAVKILIDDLGQTSDSMLDVGSEDCPYLDWYPHIRNRVSLDLKRPYTAPGVKAVKADFLEWHPDQLFDIVTCLQVLEHVPRADLFARKLLLVGRTVVVSVPYKWSPGRISSHVHDPVDEEKVRGWFGREPNFQYICREISRPAERLIQVYERHPTTWSSLSDRKKKEAAGWPPNKMRAPSTHSGWLHRKALRKLNGRLVRWLRAR